MKVNLRKLIRKTSPKKVIRAKAQSRLYLLILALSSVLFTQTMCTSTKYRLKADKAAANIIQEKQKQALGKADEFSIERPSDILRRRLLIEQDLPYASEASLGVDKLKTIEHWPEKDYPKAKSSVDQILSPEADKPLQLSLMQA